MAQHTPGPWKFNGIECIHADAPDDEGGSEIVAAMCSEDADSVFQRDEAEALANMRLIEAAPRLLEVCKQLVAVARRHTDGSARLDGAWIDDVKAVIAEAEGK